VPAAHGGAPGQVPRQVRLAIAATPAPATQAPGASAAAPSQRLEAMHQLHQASAAASLAISRHSANVAT